MATKKKNGSPPARRSAFEVIDPVFEDIVPAGEPPGPDHLRLPILPDKPEATEATGPIAETLRRLFDQIAERERCSEERIAALTADVEDFKARWLKECADHGETKSKLETVEDEVETAEGVAAELEERIAALESVLEAKGLAGWDLEFVLDSADPPGALRAITPRGQARLLKLVRS
jgi:hypothetical protein